MEILAGKQTKICEGEKGAEAGKYFFRINAYYIIFRGSAKPKEPSEHNT
jgi:hypothetical protein